MSEDVVYLGEVVDDAVEHVGISLLEAGAQCGQCLHHLIFVVPVQT